MKNTVIAALLTTSSLLAIAGGQQAQPEKGGHARDVNVVNSPNVNVVNTPAVTVSNVPAVTIGNTPSVNVANTPNVTISSNNTKPVFTGGIDEPGRIAYQAQVSMSSGSCTGKGTCFFEFNSVPAGHRVVIQHVSGIISFTNAPNAVWILLNNGSGSPVSTFFTPLAPSTSFSAFDQNVQAYFDSAVFGGLIEVQVNLGGSTFPASGFAELITLSGYELDCNAAPCAPIAQ